jgi:septal ring factor EnvC (AmiA/AmiB activator)
MMREAIDTVPMDGEFVILEDDVNGTYDVARWSADTAAWICEDGAPSRIAPTHWHPLVQQRLRAHSRGNIGSFRPAAAAQQRQAVGGASPPPGTKAATGAVAAILRDIMPVSAMVGMTPATMVTTAALPGGPTDFRRARRRGKIATIAAALVAAAVAGWWLYRSEVAGDDVAQRELEMPAVLSRQASDEASQARQAAERSAVELRQAGQQERDKAEALTRDLAAARREIETRMEAARTAGSAAAQAREAAERSAATALQALQEERARADALARDLDAARREIEAQAAASGKSGDEAARLQQAAERAAAELRQALQQEHDKAEQLARELATARRELETQAAALTKAADKTAHNQQLSELRQALQRTEASAAAYQESLAQDRSRNQGLVQQLAARRDATPDRRRNVTASLSDTPGPTQPPAADQPATGRLPTSEQPAMAAAPADNTPATAAQLAAPQSPADPDAPRLMARASLLLSQGDIGAARSVLDRAAETGSAPALFALAETYDPFVLSAWRTLGTQGDAAKARELYARALAGGVQEAKDRLNALR